MNTETSVPVAPRRRVWPWVVGILLTPFVVLGFAVTSYVTLDRDATVLRRQIMSATNSDWNTKIQFSVGGGTLGTVRTGLWFVDHENIADARLALGAVRRASVGVYELASRNGDWSSDKLLLDTDRAMQKRGWERLVGVSGKKETVLIYSSAEIDEDEPIDLCIAVLSGREMVVVSTRLDATAVAKLVERHAVEDIRSEIRRHVRF